MQEKQKLEFNGQTVNVYKRTGSRKWQCAACIDGTNHRESTKETNLVLAKAFAEEWYFRLRLKLLASAKGEIIDLAIKPRHPDAQPDRRRPRVKSGPTFGEACELFLKEYPVLTDGQRNAAYAKSHEARIRQFLIPFFGADTTLLEIPEARIIEYRMARLAGGVKGPHANPAKAPTPSTMHKDMVTLRLVFKTAKRQGLIDQIPNMTEPYSRSKKVSARPWFSREEYNQLIKATRARAEVPKKEQWAGQSADLHDLVLFAANTGLRPDELYKLQVRDITIDDEDMDGTEILHIRVAEGKMGFGHCKSTPGAVEPFRRILARRKPGPADLVFPKKQPQLFNAILGETGLKKSRDGQSRSLYSLRHTYICFRLMEGADVYVVAKNCRTSVEMIQKHYASHIKELIDVDAINVRKPRKKAIAAKPTKRKKRPAKRAA